MVPGGILSALRAWRLAAFAARALGCGARLVLCLAVLAALEMMRGQFGAFAAVFVQFFISSSLKSSIAANLFCAPFIASTNSDSLS